MRDLLTDPEFVQSLTDPDPIRRAQIQMRTPLPKRFYKEVSVGPGEGGHLVLLDGRKIRTPAKAALALPTEAAARLVADEFAAQGETIDPVSMPVMRLANAAIDGVAAEMEAVIADIVKFSSSDLVCYRADWPEGLAARQESAWKPVLAWAQSALGARFVLAAGVMHVEQPAESLEAVSGHLAARAEPFRVAALHLMTSITGSALIALAVDAGAMESEEGWTAAHVDEDWQAEQWGVDAEAAARRTARKRDFDAAVALIRAL